MENKEKEMEKTYEEVRVSLDDLKAYRSLKAKLGYLRILRDAAYNTYHSPGFSAEGKRNQPAESPVEAAVYRLEDLDSEILAIEKKVAEIEAFVESLDDDIRFLVKAKFIDFMTYEKIGRLHEFSPSGVRMKIERYFKKC